MTTSSHKTCVVVVGKNEAESIQRVIKGTQDALADIPHFILAIDDGSIDQTAEIARVHAHHVISRPSKGLGWSVRQGYHFALDHGFDTIINIDADGQHDPALLPSMVQHLENGTDAVKCSRFHEHSAVIGETPVDRLEMNQHFAEVISEITGWNITDALCGLWGFKRPVLAQLMPHLRFKHYGLCIEMLIKMKHLVPDVSLVELPHPRIYLCDTTRHKTKYTSDGEAHRKRRFAHHQKHVAIALAHVEHMRAALPA